MQLKDTGILQAVKLVDKVAGGRKVIVSLSEAEGEKVRQTLDETYRLIDTMLNIAIIRLGDIQISKGSFYIEHRSVIEYKGIKIDFSQVQNIN